MPRAELAGKRMAIHARKLALEPDLQILRRHRRPLLRRLEQAHRSALADHVARTTRLGPWVLIRESWYKFRQRDWRPARSSVANSSSESLIAAAPTFSSRCATLPVPGIGSMTGLRLSSQASAIWPGLALCLCAMASNAEPGLADAPASSGA